MIAGTHVKQRAQTYKLCASPCERKIPVSPRDLPILENYLRKVNYLLYGEAGATHLTKHARKVERDHVPTVAF